MDDLQSTVNSRARSGAVRRQVILALVLALLAILILAVTANAYVAQRTHDTLADFDRGMFTFTGLLDIPEEDIDSVQLLPVGLKGDLKKTDETLPEALTGQATLAISDAIYVIGGTGTDYYPRSDVRLYTVSDAQGRLARQPDQSALPGARSDSGIAAYRDSGSTATMYVLGGWDVDDQPTDTVFRAQIDVASGAMIGEWISEPHVLPQPVAHAQAVEHDGYLYLLGGSGLDASEYFTSFQQVYAAPINPDGSLGGAFTGTSPLPRPLFYGYAVVYEGDITDTLYYVGGEYYVPAPEPYYVQSVASEEVYFADFLPGGGLTEWRRSEGALPRPLSGHSGVLVNGFEMIVIGGIFNRWDAEETFNSTAKVALVDPDNASFRLYNWCEHVPEPCYLGAWQTGASLEGGEVRALHGTVRAGDYIYVMGGQDGSQDATNTIFTGSIRGEGAFYAPAGEYLSEKIDLGQPAALRKLTWQASLTPTGRVTLTMEYRTSTDGDHWDPWVGPVVSYDGVNEIEPSPPHDGIRFIQYKADFSTVLTHASPRLDEVHIFYEVPDPDLSISKDTGSVITVGLGSPLEYTIHYSNTGGWVAENSVITEILPAHTSYAGGPEWHQIGSSEMYTYLLGNVERNESGSIPFEVKVDDEIPPAVYSITNRVEIDYPPMIDAFADVITDENQYDNWYEISNPLSFYAMTVTKEALPPAGTAVTAGSLITYTLRYTNVGLARASQVVLTDTFDERGTYAVVTPSVPATATEYVWNLGPLEPRQSGAQQVVVRVQDPLPTYGFVTNQASLSSPEGEVYHTAVITHPLAASVMTVTKEAFPPAGEAVAPGSLITYTLRYTNLAATRASRVVLTDTFDKRGTYAVVTPSIPPTATEYVWNLGPLEPRQAGAQQVVVLVQDPLLDYGFLTNQASLTGPGGEIYQTPIITHPLAVSVMTVTKEAFPPAGQPVTPGSLITYTLRYTNLGATRASRVVLTDTFDQQGNYTIVTPPIPPTATAYVWNLDSLGPGESGEQQIVVRVQDPLPNHWVVTNQASLHSPGGDAHQTPVITHPIMNMSGTQPAPMVDLVVADVQWEPTEVVSGTWPEFTVSIRNAGSKDTTDYFRTSLYIKPAGSSPPSWPSDHDRGYCLFGCNVTRPSYVKYVATLSAGDMLALSFGGLDGDFSPDFPSAGTYDIYVQVDVAFEGDNWYWGRVAEDREDNNVWHGMLTIEDSGPTEPPRIYMPIVMRSFP